MAEQFKEGAKSNPEAHLDPANDQFAEQVEIVQQAASSILENYPDSPAAAETVERYVYQIEAGLSQEGPAISTTTPESPIRMSGTTALARDESMTKPFTVPREPEATWVIPSEDEFLAEYLLPSLFILISARQLQASLAR